MSHSKRKHVNPNLVRAQSASGRRPALPSAPSLPYAPLPAVPAAKPGLDPLVTIVITTYNRPALLPKAIKSVLGQHYKRVECLVVNDGGEDVSGVIASFNDDRLRYVTKPNGGLASARNFGIAQAQGEIIGFLDDDDWLLPDHVRVLELTLRDEPCAIAYSNAEYIHQRRRGSEMIEVGRNVPFNQDWDERLILLQNFIPVCCLLSRRQVFENCLFDETFPVLEDWDWLIRVSRIYRLVHVARNTCVVTAREDGSTMSSSGDLPFMLQTRRIYLTYNREAGRNPQLEQARNQRLGGYQAALAVKGQQEFILAQIMASPDPVNLTRTMKPILTPNFLQVANSLKEQAEAAGDQPSVEALLHVMQAAIGPDNA